MKKLSGFSLMEMMVVLLIISIVAAASAPMVNKKMLGAASDKSPWVWTGMTKNIAYNLNDADITASIGSVNPPMSAKNARIYVDTKRGSGTTITPQIALGQDNGKNVLKLTAANNNLWVSNKDMPTSVSNSILLGNATNTIANNSIAIGINSNAESTNSIALGYSSHAKGTNSMAVGTYRAYNTVANGTNSLRIGYSIRGGGQDSIALGYNSSAYYKDCIAIGRSSNADFPGAVSIGAESNAWFTNSTALGYRANAYAHNSIAIGGGANCEKTGSRAISIGLLARGNKTDSVAVGYQANATASNAISMGYLANSSSYNSIAIGPNARATSSNAIALGYNAQALYSNAVAIGRNAKTTKSNQIVLGTSSDTVVVPGTIEFSDVHITGSLVVDGSCVLGRTGGEVILRTQPGPPSEKSKYGNSELSRIFMGDDKGGDDNTRTLRKYGWSYNIGGFHISSDRRLKNIGKNFTAGLDEIKKLEVFNFTFKQDKSKTPHVGVMAQDLQKIFPNAVIKGEDGFLRIRMEDMFYALVNAVKTNDSRITALEIENIELKKRLAELEKKLK